MSLKAVHQICLLLTLDQMTSVMASAPLLLLLLLMLPLCSTTQCTTSMTWTNNYWSLQWSGTRCRNSQHYSMLFMAGSMLVQGQLPQTLALPPNVTWNTRLPLWLINWLIILFIMTYASIFYARIVNIWNSLPNSIVDASTVNAFKARLDKLAISNFSPLRGLALL